MAKKIVWTPVAIQDLSGVLEYLNDTWPEAIAAHFSKALEGTVEMIQSYPELGISSISEPNVRRVLISKHNALYYEFDETVIVILRIIDTRSSAYSDDSDRT